MKNTLELGDGQVRLWIEQEAIHLITRDEHGDPVEITIAEAERLAGTLREWVAKLTRISPLGRPGSDRGENEFDLSGYEIEGDRLLKMQEVTIQAGPSTLREIARFINRSADLMEKHGAKFGHEHYADSQSGSEWKKGHSDIVVTGK